MLTAAQTRVLERVRQRQILCREIKEVIVERLDLDLDPDWLTDDQAILGRGLELDSIHVIEVVVGIEWQFKVNITDDELDRFGSVNMLADFIESRREDA
ncbi:acyl carrier protein [Embleya sp. AB8]|uniref:acyl carrier protein n=1 Tax=Embleya sp. AB8 TaxID=3156304 RepID=UPI003C729990